MFNELWMRLVRRKSDEHRRISLALIDKHSATSTYRQQECRSRRKPRWLRKSSTEKGTRRTVVLETFATWEQKHVLLGLHVATSRATERQRKNIWQNSVGNKQMGTLRNQEVHGTTAKTESRNQHAVWIKTWDAQSTPDNQNCGLLRYNRRDRKRTALQRTVA